MVKSREQTNSFIIISELHVPMRPGYDGHLHVLEVIGKVNFIGRNKTVTFLLMQNPPLPEDLRQRLLPGPVHARHRRRH